MSVRVGFYVALVVLFLTLVIAVAQEKATASRPAPQSSDVFPLAAGGQYAESDFCKSCHEEFWNKSVLLKAASTDVSSANGRGHAHIDGGGDVTND